MGDKDREYMLTMFLIKDMLKQGIISKEMFADINKEMIVKYEPLIPEELT